MCLPEFSVSDHPPLLRTYSFFLLLISQWESIWSHVSLLRNTRYSLLPMECWGLLVSQGWRWYIFSHSPKVLQFSSWEGRSKGQRDSGSHTEGRALCLQLFSLPKGNKAPSSPPLLSSVLHLALICFFIHIPISYWIPGTLLNAGVMPQLRPGTISWGSWF